MQLNIRVEKIDSNEVGSLKVIFAPSLTGPFLTPFSIGPTYLDVPYALIEDVIQTPRSIAEKWFVGACSNVTANSELLSRCWYILAGEGIIIRG